MAYLLPLTSDGERTFSVVLGSNTYFFRSYYVRGQESAWLLDISDAGGSMLASGVKLVPGSPNCLAGYGDAFNGENIVVTLSRGKPGDEEAPGDTLNVLWFPEGEESPFTLGPLEEWRGKSRGEIVQFKSDGTLEGLRVTGTFQKTLMGMPQPSQISIYNLSRDTRNAIKGSLTKIAVEAGWNNTDLRKVFQGSIMSSSSERSGPDIVTKLVALPGYGSLVRGVSSVTFGAGTPVSVAAQKLASDLPGMTVQGGNFQGVAGNIGPRGWSYAGSTKDGLTRLGEEHGFSWSVQDGEVTAIGDRFMLGSYVELNGENGGLISIAPTLTGPMQIQSGVKIKALYVPGISAGHSIKVNSTLNPRLSGTYRIHTMSINIDAYSEAWTMDIESFRFPPGKK